MGSMRCESPWAAWDLSLNVLLQFLARGSVPALPEQRLPPVLSLFVRNSHGLIFLHLTILQWRAPFLNKHKEWSYRIQCHRRHSRAGVGLERPSHWKLDTSHSVSGFPHPQVEHPQVALSTEIRDLLRLVILDTECLRPSGLDSSFPKHVKQAWLPRCPPRLSSHLRWRHHHSEIPRPSHRPSPTGTQPCGVSNSSAPEAPVNSPFSLGLALHLFLQLLLPVSFDCAHDWRSPAACCFCGVPLSVAARAGLRIPLHIFALSFSFAFRDWVKCLNCGNQGLRQLLNGTRLAPSFTCIVAVVHRHLPEFQQGRFAPQLHSSWSLSLVPVHVVCHAASLIVVVQVSSVGKPVLDHCLREPSQKKRSLAHLVRDVIVVKFSSRNLWRWQTVEHALQVVKVFRARSLHDHREKRRGVIGGPCLDPDCKLSSLVESMHLRDRLQLDCSIFLVHSLKQILWPLRHFFQVLVERVLVCMFQSCLSRMSVGGLGSHHEAGYEHTSARNSAKLFLSTRIAMYVSGQNFSASRLLSFDLLLLGRPDHADDRHGRTDFLLNILQQLVSRVLQLLEVSRSLLRFLQQRPCLASSSTSLSVSITSRSELSNLLLW